MWRGDKSRSVTDLVCSLYPEHTIPYLICEFYLDKTKWTVFATSKLFSPNDFLISSGRSASSQAESTLSYCYII